MYKRIVARGSVLGSLHSVLWHSYCSIHPSSAPDFEKMKGHIAVLSVHPVCVFEFNVSPTAKAHMEISLKQRTGEARGIEPVTLALKL